MIRKRAEIKTKRVANATYALGYAYIMTFKASGVDRNLLREDKEGVWGWKSSSGVQGQSPGGGLGAKPPLARDKC